SLWTLPSIVVGFYLTEHMSSSDHFPACEMLLGPAPFSFHTAIYGAAFVKTMKSAPGAKASRSPRTDSPTFFLKKLNAAHHALSW
ncbi:hypothetical protein, partial [Sutterella wadsworthensis]|uniref:hypothetical protein n=1 Tax=Sutterella wadsworthensis TaxID=40545 RepID=UPI003FF06CF6